MLAKAPGVTLVAVVCLALGIGVNSTIFSIVDTIAIKALPFRDPDRLVVEKEADVGAVPSGDSVCRSC